MTETENVATYARIRPYNPAINEDKRLTARAADGNKVLNMNGDNEDTYNFTKVFDDSNNNADVFNNAMKPLMDYKILQGINSIFIVYGQSGSGKSFTLIGEEGHLGVLPMSLQYLLNQTDKVQRIDLCSIEAYGIKATKIGFYDLVVQYKERLKVGKNKFDVWATKDNSRVTSANAQTIQITKDNCLKIITELQDVSHMAPTLKNPHSSRGHTVYFARIKMKELEDVYFIAVDLAGSEGQTALGTKDEFVEGLRLAMSKGKLDLGKKDMKNFELMYKTRSLEAGCINNGLTQLQSIFGELVRKKISKSKGLGLRKVLSSFISLKSAYAIMFTMSASANNNKVTKATLNFAKQTQLVKVDTQKAKKKIDKDAIIKKLQAIIDELKKDITAKDQRIIQLEKGVGNVGIVRATSDESSTVEVGDLNAINSDNDETAVIDLADDGIQTVNSEESKDNRPQTTRIHHNKNTLSTPLNFGGYKRQPSMAEIKYDELQKEIKAAQLEEEKWTAKVQQKKTAVNDEVTKYNRQLMRHVTRAILSMDATQSEPFKQAVLAEIGDDDDGSIVTDSDFDEDRKGDINEANDDNEDPNGVNNIGRSANTNKDGMNSNNITVVASGDVFHKFLKGPIADKVSQLFTGIVFVSIFGVVVLIDIILNCIDWSKSVAIANTVISILTSILIGTMMLALNAKILVEIVKSFMFWYRLIFGILTMTGFTMWQYNASNPATRLFIALDGIIIITFYTFIDSWNIKPLFRAILIGLLDIGFIILFFVWYFSPTIDNVVMILNRFYSAKLMALASILNLIFLLSYDLYVSILSFRTNLILSPILQSNTAINWLSINNQVESPPLTGTTLPIKVDDTTATSPPNDQLTILADYSNNMVSGSDPDTPNEQQKMMKITVTTPDNISSIPETPNE